MDGIAIHLSGGRKMGVRDAPLVLLMLSMTSSGVEVGRRRGPEIEMQNYRPT